MDSLTGCCARDAQKKHAARELDPLGVKGTSEGWILFHSRRFEEATRQLHSVLAVYPDDASAQWFLGFALIGNGQSEEAIPLLEKTVSVMHRSPGSVELLAMAYAQAGHRTDVRKSIIAATPSTSSVE